MKEQLSEIRRKIKLRDNGPAVDILRKLGIDYKSIHGLSLAEIKIIAQPYQFNHELAIELWNWDHREFKILSTLIENPKEVSIEQLQKWGADLKNSELAEQLAINLAFNSPLVEPLIPIWLSNENIFSQKAGLVLLAWSAQKGLQLDDSFFAEKLNEITGLITDDLQLSKGISFAIRAIGKRNKYLNTLAIEQVLKLKKADDFQSKLIVEDALWELESDIIQERLAQK